MRLFATFLGYSPEYIDEILHKKKKERETLAIDLHRPTFIKVHRKYLHPDTLDYYGLPWEWDSVSFVLPKQTSALVCSVMMRDTAKAD